MERIFGLSSAFPLIMIPISCLAEDLNNFETFKAEAQSKIPVEKVEKKR